MKKLFSKAGTFVPKGPPNESLMRKPLLLRLSPWRRRRYFQKDDETANEHELER